VPFHSCPDRTAEKLVAEGWHLSKAFPLAVPAMTSWLMLARSSELLALFCFFLYTFLFFFFFFFSALVFVTFFSFSQISSTPSHKSLCPPDVSLGWYFKGLFYFNWSGRPLRDFPSASAPAPPGRNLTLAPCFDFGPPFLLSLVFFLVVLFVLFFFFLVNFFVFIFFFFFFFFFFFVFFHRMFFLARLFFYLCLACL